MPALQNTLKFVTPSLCNCHLHWWQLFREETIFSTGWFSCRSSILVEFDLGVLVFAEGGKLLYPEKNLSKAGTRNKLDQK